MSELLLKPGTLWTKLNDRTELALKSGALQPIPTEYEFVEDNGISFLVRVLTNLDRKDKDKKKQEKKKTETGKDFNPFLPYEEELFVSDISPTHLCLLNKFNVVDRHLLIVTRAFEEQDNWLNDRDFEATWACLQEIDGLAFYNGGKIAGASQRHKHLQIVPLPLASDREKMPIEPAIAAANFNGSVGKVADFPFVHALGKLDPNWNDREAAAGMLECYKVLLDAVGLPQEKDKQSGAYNFLATREWMLIVPRDRECFDSISVNSLGFAGALLVRNKEQLERLKEYRPINVLKSVARSI
jgi:ATP adenylyltransferase